MRELRVSELFHCLVSYDCNLNLVRRSLFKMMRIIFYAELVILSCSFFLRVRFGSVLLVYFQHFGSISLPSASFKIFLPRGTI